MKPLSSLSKKSSKNPFIGTFAPPHVSCWKGDWEVWTPDPNQTMQSRLGLLQWTREAGLTRNPFSKSPRTVWGLNKANPLRILNPGFKQAGQTCTCPSSFRENQLSCFPLSSCSLPNQHHIPRTATATALGAHSILCQQKQSNSKTA